ncbi:hypothetical protein BpHYR1_031401 [Brachionus plicatilis]|uniref:Uncharacterized protein n=1 Tax=Brachionus plicatilis TaxID=10195 RepID=A0A3M7T928_BRAPC|nr:hypothetical protein BpHYR1_031401 [Brachionus plicatilis]
MFGHLISIQQSTWIDCIYPKTNLTQFSQNFNKFSGKLEFLIRCKFHFGPCTKMNLNRQSNSIFTEFIAAPRF